MAARGPAQVRNHAQRQASPYVALEGMGRPDFGPPGCRAVQILGRLGSRDPCFSPELGFGTDWGDEISCGTHSEAPIFPLPPRGFLTPLPTERTA